MSLRNAFDKMTAFTAASTPLTTASLAAAALAVAALTPAAALAAEDPSFNKDLLATIALQGMPCDQIISSKRNGDSDYTAACKNGNRYHVYVNAQGRVIVQKL